MVASRDVPQEYGTAMAALVAHMLVDDPTAWAAAIAQSGHHGFGDRAMLHMINSGYYFCGEQLIEGIERLRVMYDEDSLEDLLNAVTERISVAPDTRPAGRIRRIVR